jgi:hypothetical protein
MAMLARAFLVAILAAWCGLAAAETSVHVGSGASGLQFDFLYSSYGVQPDFVEHEVIFVGEPDLLVSLHLARATAIDVNVIVGWRRAGMSWDRITRRCHKDSRVYYVDLPDDVTGPLYARARGHWKKHRRGDIALTDAEIRELVLVLALSGHCKVPAAEVVRRRAAGENAGAIAAGRKSRSEDTAPKAPRGNSHGGGKGKK